MKIFLKCPACHIKSKFHENKDWNQTLQELTKHASDIKSKFHENKDWNCIYPRYSGLLGPASRASSTKTRIETWRCAIAVWRPRKHQEQVPRKQGLKQDYHVQNI